MKLPAEEKRHYFAKENIDYQITLEEFNTWFMEEGEGFIRLDDTNTVLTISDIFAKKARGVFFSQQPGFVAWALAKNADLLEYEEYGHLARVAVDGHLARVAVDEQGARVAVDGQGARVAVDGQDARTPFDGQDARTPFDGQDARAPIRQFTLDADLILGALADSSTLVIIGRERQSPLYELPPLQIESILLLASTTEKELSQSLDINDLMAGKMNNGRDWCPTYLSRELENTEFGDLMTITDVLLKDWSERGTIQEGYYRYEDARQLWRQTDNAAGLSLDTIRNRGYALFEFAHRDGDYRRVQEGGQSNQLTFKTERYQTIAGVLVGYGRFHFNMDHTKDRAWCDVMRPYNPVHARQ